MLFAALLGLAVAAPPSAAKAQAMAKQKQWEELYLGFAAASPDGLSKGDRAKVAAALAAGCSALQGDDPVMAFGLGDKSVTFAPTAEGLYCTALTAKRSDQRGAAEEALGRGLSSFPKDGRFALELGRLYQEDGQAREALATLAKVPAKSKESAEARRLIAQLSPQAPPEVPLGAPDVTVAPPTAGLPALAPTSRSYESGVDEEGRRVRQNQYFRFRYFNAKRDFGQRADFEGRVQAALEEGRVAVERLLGAAREKPLDVILYSRAEFTLHHGPQAAAAIAGFYSADAIRMNDSAEINDRTRAVLVHEYVHAVMDEVTSFQHASIPVWLHEGTAEYVEWRFQGLDGPPFNEAKYVQQLAARDQLPKLGSFGQGPLIGTSNPGLAYVVSALAVRLLIERRSMNELLELMRDCGRGTSFPQALERRFGTTVERLDEELASTLKSR